MKRRHRCLGKRLVILVCVFRVGDETKIWLNFPINILDEHDELPTTGQLRVGVVAKKYILGAHYPGRLELFRFPDIGVAFAGSIGNHK